MERLRSCVDCAQFMSWYCRAIAYPVSARSLFHVNHLRKSTVAIVMRWSGAGHVSKGVLRSLPECCAQLLTMVEHGFV